MYGDAMHTWHLIASKHAIATVYRETAVYLRRCMQIVWCTGVFCGQLSSQKTLYHLHLQCKKHFHGSAAGLLSYRQPHILASAQPAVARLTFTNRCQYAMLSMSHTSTELHQLGNRQRLPITVPKFGLLVFVTATQGVQPNQQRQSACRAQSKSHCCKSATLMTAASS